MKSNKQIKSFNLHNKNLFHLENILIFIKLNNYLYNYALIEISQVSLGFDMSRIKIRLEIEFFKTYYEIKHQGYARIDGMKVKNIKKILLFFQGDNIDKGKLMFNTQLIIE